MNSNSSERIKPVVSHIQQQQQQQQGDSFGHSFHNNNRSPSNGHFQRYSFHNNRNFHGNRTRLGVNGYNLSTRRSFNILPSGDRERWAIHTKAVNNQRSLSQDRIHSESGRLINEHLNNTTGSSRGANRELFQRGQFHTKEGNTYTERSSSQDRGSTQRVRFQTDIDTICTDKSQSYCRDRSASAGFLAEGLGSREKDLNREGEEKMTVTARSLSVTVDPSSYRFTPIQHHISHGKNLVYL